jgi:hypothetical protein
MKQSYLWALKVKFTYAGIKKFINFFLKGHCFLKLGIQKYRPQFVLYEDTHYKMHALISI